MSNPLLFISHKEDDAKIGNVLATFVRDITGGSVEVYLSSEPGFQGPRVGKELGNELREALWRAGVVVLVYTSMDQDWSFCMWECGLAEDPRSRGNTKVVVVQCLEDSPAMFAGNVRVQAWEPASLFKFAKRFQEPQFFAGEERAVTKLTEAELRVHAQNLHARLSKVIQREPAEKWSPWPFVRLELSKAEMDSLKADASEEDAGATRTLLKGSRILTWGGNLPALFGKVQLVAGATFDDLVASWCQNLPKRSLGWLDVLAAEIVYSAQRAAPQILPEDTFLGVGGDTEYRPTVSEVESSTGKFQVDCLFVGVSKAADTHLRNKRLLGEWKCAWWAQGPYRPKGEASAKETVLEDEERIEDKAFITEVTDGELSGRGENEERGNITIKGRIHDANFVTVIYEPEILSAEDDVLRGGTAILRLSRTRRQMHGFWYEFDEDGEFWGGSTAWERK